MYFRFPTLKLFSTLTLLLVVTLVVGSNAYAGLPPTQEPEPGDGAETVTIQASEEMQLATIQKWTRKARANAEPVPFPTGSLDELTVETLEKEDLGEPVFLPGGLPDPEAHRIGQYEYVEEIGALLAAESFGGVGAAGSAGVYTSFQGNKYRQMWKQFPYLTVGKLYIDGGGYCSASVISPNNIIVTAAHCVYDTDTNTWETGWTFVPAERNYAAPYGTFPWASATVLNAWMNASDSLAGRRYDVALIKLGNNSQGRPVKYYTGWLGLAWGLPYRQHLHAIGYPSNLTGGVKRTYICAAESFKKSYQVVGMGCDMMHGSSGGPWILEFAPYTTGAVNYVNSVVSGGLPDSTWGNTFYGPRFNNGNIGRLCNAQGC